MESISNEINSRPTISVSCELKWSIDFKNEDADRPFLMISTPEINDEILDMIDIEEYNWNSGGHIRDNMNICFTYKRVGHFDNNVDIKFCPSDYKWKRFAEKVDRLIIHGNISNGFSANHLLECKKLKLLFLGASSDTLFNDENIESLHELYNLKYIRLNGFGLVNYGENVERWFNYMKENNNTQVVHIY